MDMWNAPMVQSTAFDIQVDGTRRPGRPKLTRKQVTERDCRKWKLSAIDTHDRHTWRSSVKSAMPASQLPRRGPTDVDAALHLHLHINQKSHDDDDDDDDATLWGSGIRNYSIS